jgi:hypothetical protein
MIDQPMRISINEIFEKVIPFVDSVDIHCYSIFRDHRG